jgi:predicted MFS family arabinose efflux permease
VANDSAAPPAAPRPDSVAPGEPAASLWRHRPFLSLWGGQTVSEVGSQISSLLLPLLAVSVLHATTFEVAVLGAFRSVPFLLLALPAGVVVDRVRRRRLMLGCDLARFAFTASLPLAALWWHVTLGQLYAVAAAVGVLTVFFDVAYQSYVPSLVGPDLLMDANGRLGTTQSLAEFAGPPLGGVLTGALGAARAVSADALSYAVSAVSLLLIRVPEAHPVAGGTGERIGFRAAMSEGLRFLLGHPILRKVVACTATANFGSGAFGALEVVFLVRTLHARPAVVGAVLGLAAVGGVVGGVLAGPLTRWIGSARVIWLSLLAAAPLGFLMPLATPGWGVLLYAVGWGSFSASGVVYNTAQLSYRQSICPPGLLGRLNASVRWIAWGAIPLGSVVGGALATALGVRPALWIGLSLTAVAPLWVLCSPLRTMRDVPAPVVASA